MRLKVVAKAIIQDDEGRVLLLKRSSTDDRRPGEWDFPGGGVEPGEGLSDAVVREVKEEIGVSVPISDLSLVYAATSPWQPDSVSITRLLFIGTIPAGDIHLSFEHDEYKWVSIDRALTDFPHFFYATGLKYAQEHGLLK